MPYLIQPLLKLYGMGFIGPILQVEKLRLREIRKVARETHLVEPKAQTLLPQHT